MVTPRQSVSFPDVAVIHKGTPKQIIEKDGRPVEIQGKDLNNKFRVHFLPGTDDVRRDWHTKHAAEFKEYGPKFTIPSGYEVESLRVVIPAPSVWEAWSYGNEAFSSGRRIALADDEHYITYRDPATGEYLIRDGKPFKKFTPGDTISYTHNGREIVLPMKSHGRLRLVLEDMVNAGHLVQVILKTTSFYDCGNINRQLAGIQSLADSISGGNAGGIPLLIYRAEQEVTWNKKDGGASRIKKWFINLKADPNWVKFAFSQLGKHALSAPGMNMLMAPAPAIVGEVNPEQEEFLGGDEDDMENVIDSEDEPQPDQEQPVVTIKSLAQSEPASAPGEPPPEALPYLSDEIVTAVAKRAGISKADAAKILAYGEKKGLIGKKITKADAIQYAARARSE